MNYHYKRFPETDSNNLKAWNAADELLIKTLDLSKESVGVYNDAFGYLTVNLHENVTNCITDLKSQELAIKQNLDINGLVNSKIQFLSPIETADNTIEIAVLKVPKSVELFELFIQHIHQNLTDHGTVYCGFMTKYFNASLLKIADQYFENVTQTKALKKARLLVLQNKKPIPNKALINEIDYRGLKIKQYYGVFSSDKIDFGTQFLLDHLTIPQQAESILDLASGNGIISKVIQDKQPLAKLYLMDDSAIAIASSRLNLSEKNTYFHHSHVLEGLPKGELDWIITNPPFHFGHTIDISIPLNLFKESYLFLKPGGQLTIVANINLGYLPQLKQLFQNVSILAKNTKFIIYNCVK